jgi:hypothetical protein
VSRFHITGSVVRVKDRCRMFVSDVLNNLNACELPTSDPKRLTSLRTMTRKFKFWRYISLLAVVFFCTLSLQSPPPYFCASVSSPYPSRMRFSGL